MENKTRRIKQITGAFLAAVIFVFSVGSSMAESSAKPFLSDNNDSVTKAVSKTAPQERSDNRAVSVLHVAVIQVSVFKANIPFARYINCEAFFVNSHVRNAIYALPNIHAP